MELDCFLRSDLRPYQLPFGAGRAPVAGDPGGSRLPHDGHAFLAGPRRPPPRWGGNGDGQVGDQDFRRREGGPGPHFHNLSRNLCGIWGRVWGRPRVEKRPLTCCDAGGRWWFRTTDLRLVRAIRSYSLTWGGAGIIQGELRVCRSMPFDAARRFSTCRGISAESQQGKKLNPSGSRRPPFRTSRDALPAPLTRPALPYAATVWPSRAPKTREDGSQDANRGEIAGARRAQAQSAQ
jgi:hypothetical protein